MRQLIPALLLLTLLLPAAAAAQSPVTRVQFVAALWTCSGAVPYDANGPFSDVNPNSPGATAVAWAYDLGIVRGTGGTLFVPDRPITREAAGTVRVGSGASFTDLEESPIIRECIPMLGESAASVAGPQIRNMGTIGGNLCNGAVSAAPSAPVLALNGYLNI